MTNIRLFAAIAVSVVLTALVMGAITRPAHAGTPGNAVCTAPFKGTAAAMKTHPEAGSNVNALSLALMQDWMNEQLAAGRTQFAPAPGDGGSGICAW